MNSNQLVASIQNAKDTFQERYEELRRLKVAIVTSSSIRAIGAGDWQQAERTVSAMRDLCLNVEHVILDDNQTEDGLREFDVVHFMPFGRGLRFADVASRLKATRAHHVRIVASPVYWDSWRHRYMEVTGAAERAKNLARGFWLTTARSCAGLVDLARKSFEGTRARLHKFADCDLLLPNSFAEAKALHSRFLLPQRTAVCPVPNGIHAPPLQPEYEELPRELPKDDYVLYPAFFSPRKNQLGFIRAMRRQDIPVIFMGGPVGTDDGHRYWELCKREAPRHHFMLGTVPYRSPLFYSLLRKARVCCLASSCETPGLAALEAAMMGARVAITREGGADEYLGDCAEYFSPLLAHQIRSAVERAVRRGRDETQRDRLLKYFTWESVAGCTAASYLQYDRAGTTTLTRSHTEGCS